MNLYDIVNACDHFYKQATLIQFSTKTYMEVAYWIKDMYEKWLSNDLSGFTKEVNYGQIQNGKYVKNIDRVQKIFEYDFESIPYDVRDIGSLTLGVQLNIKELSNSVVSAAARPKPLIGSGNQLSIKINIESPKVVDSGLKNGILAEVYNALQHEMRHISQYLLAYLKGNKKLNIDERSDLLHKFKNTSQTGQPPWQNIQELEYLKDMELQPYIGTVARRFVIYLTPQSTLEQAKPEIENIIRNDNLFKTLYKYDKIKWQYAVKKLYEYVRNYIDKRQSKK